MGVSAVEGHAAAGEHRQGHDELVETLSEVVQNGLAPARHMGDRRQDHSDIHENQQRQNARHTANNVHQTRW